MHNYTRKEIMELVEDEDVGFIRLQFTDIYGTMKNMAVTVSLPDPGFSGGGGVGSIPVSRPEHL